MSGEHYTQIKRPVSRLAEKILGWLSWIILLLLTFAGMFLGLVTFSNDASIAKLEQSLNNSSFFQDVFAQNNLNTTQVVIFFQNGVWLIIVYLIICLLITFLALISMNIRILSGLLFLLASVVTLPFIILLVPVLLFIAAIMMFARKAKYVTVPARYGERDVYDERPYHHEKPKAKDNNRNEYDRNRQDTYEEPEKTMVMNRQDVEKETRGDAQETEETPQVLSRQQKYNHKPVKPKDEKATKPSEEDSYERQLERQREQARQKEMEEQRLHQQQALREEKERAKAERKERKRLKKEQKAKEKARRKAQMSAGATRRKNYDDRLKMQKDQEKTDSNETK